MSWFSQALKGQGPLAPVLGALGMPILPQQLSGGTPPPQSITIQSPPQSYKGPLIAASIVGVALIASVGLAVASIRRR